MGDFERTVREFKRTLTGGRQKTSPLDIMGKVTRVEDGVAWVRFAGSEVGDTPVRMNIDCKVGDDVQVRSSGGKAWIVGNQSAPPTDDTKAEEVEKKTAEIVTRVEKAEKVAGSAADVANAANQKVWSDEAGLHIADGKQDAAAERNTIWNSLGMLFRKGLNPILGVLTGDNPRVAIYDGQGSGEEHEVASFGEKAIIGSINAYKAITGAGSYGILSPDDVELFNFKPSGNPSLDIVAVREDVVGGESTSITLNHTPQSGSFMVFYWTTNSAQQLTTFRAGEAKTTIIGERFKISYDGDKTITIDSLDEYSTAYVDYVVYRYISNSIDLGALTVGTRQPDTDLGSGSATIGRDLTATQSYQVAVGIRNEGFEDSVFEVGNGKNETRHTAFSVQSNNAIREGYNTTASGDCSHSEGRYTTASGSRSHSEGGFSTASGDYSHSEGYNATASGHAAHAEGSGTKASGICSHAEGSDTIASSDYQHVEGKYNIEDANSKYAHIIGNGTSEDTRSNALTVDWNGTIRTHKDSMKTLLTTASYMGGNQDLTFSEPVSEQLTGIVLVWSFWSGSQAEDWGWETFYIPKAMVQLHNGVGYDCPLSRPKSSYFGNKYVYIYDTHIKGHADNVATGTANNVPYQNNKWVLRYVFGC